MSTTFSFLSPSRFDWSEAPPLSSFRAVATAGALYITLVVLSTVLSRRLMPADGPSTSPSSGKARRTNLQWRPWFGSDLQGAQFLHNVVLVLSSAVMCGGVLVEGARRLRRDGAAWPPFPLCEVVDGPPARGSLYYWSYVYYLSKYYELLDTALQLARGKPPPHFVLHVYHHAAVLVMAWAWVEYRQTLHFVGLVWNTAVHVVMYTYFLQRTITGAVPRWKSLVTLFQIVQFAFSMVAAVCTLYIVYVQRHECAGMTAMFGNLLFNVTLLHSFIGVFRQGKGRKRQ